MDIVQTNRAGTLNLVRIEDNQLVVRDTNGGFVRGFAHGHGVRLNPVTDGFEDLGYVSRLPLNLQ